MSKKAVVFVGIILAMLVAVGVGVWAFSLNSQQNGGDGSDSEKLKVAVSILPQVTFVEAVGGDQVEVFELVPPGASPATYELKPSQMTDLGAADLYFRIGHIPFEKNYVSQIETNNENLKIIDTSEGVLLRHLGAHTHGV